MDRNDEVQRVEVETESEPVGGARGGEENAQGGPGGFSFRFGSFGTDGFRSFASGDPRAPLGKPPVIAAWLCLAAAWLFLGSSIPFTVILGVPLALAALLCGAACLTRGAMVTGLAVLALGSIGSFAVYLVGLFRLFFE